MCKRGTTLSNRTGYRYNSFTGGGFSIHPMAEYSCVSIDKAALRSLACTLHQELKEKGIFVGIVTIMGNVVPKLTMHRKNSRSVLENVSGTEGLGIYLSVNLRL